MTEGRSDAFIFFGITGDLAYKQVIPAVQELVADGHLDMPIIGVAASGTLDQLKARIRDSLQQHGPVDEGNLSKLYSQLQYVAGDYEDPATFQQLRSALGNAQRPLAYLAIPPTLFGLVSEQLTSSGCARGARIMVEKPFGRNLESARHLNKILHEHFPEESIFRIDHYIDKESFLNMAYFRVANTMIEPIWNSRYIESVQITMSESFGIKGRGKFYEETGAIRDVVQNHVLQVAATIAMEPIHNCELAAISEAKAAAMEAMRPIEPSNLVRGQFRGYRDEPGVAPDSNVETFGALRLESDSDRWNGVPFYLRAGKSLPVTCTEAIVKLRHTATHLDLDTQDDSNYLRFRLTPTGDIALGVYIKEPGDRIVGAATELLAHHQPGREEAPYERLILHASQGDRSVFVGERTVEAAWRVVDPILDQSTPPEVYSPGTWGPAAADRITADNGGWHNPSLSQ